MKKMDYLIIMSTETGEQIPVTKSDIVKKHTSSTANGGFGWNRPGIDYLIQLDGSLTVISPEESITEVDLWGISEGKEGLFGSAKYLAYVGGKTAKATKAKDTRTDDQNETLEAVLKFYVKRFPDVRILAYNQVPSRIGYANPAFDVSEWLKTIGINEKNIFKSA